MLAFTYGTLKKGQRNEPLLDNQAFIGKAHTVEYFKLYSIQGNYSFPALVGDPTGYSVYGELYDISEKCAEYLDGIEGVAMGLYRRKMISVSVVTDGDIHTETDVLVYEYARNDYGDQHRHPHVGCVWPMSELPKFQFAGIQVVVAQKDVNVEGVALWSRRKDCFVTDMQLDEAALKIHCIPKRQLFGATGVELPWSADHFEVRPSSEIKEQTIYQLIHVVNGETPEFDTQGELTTWLGDSQDWNLFGETSTNAQGWKKVLTEFII